MKNKWMTLFVLGLTIAAFAVVPAFAHGGQPPVNPQNAPFGGGGGLLSGFMHDDMVALMADTLGLDAAEIEARLAAGESMYTMLAEAGYTSEEIISLKQDLRLQSLQMAMENGWITAEQYQWMVERMSNWAPGAMMGYGRGGMMGNSQRGAGNCTGAGAGMGGAFGSQNRP